MTSAQLSHRDTDALERGRSQCHGDLFDKGKNVMRERDFVLYGPDGDPAATVSGSIVQIDWRAIEDLASCEGDPSPRARNIAKLLLAARDQSEGEQQ